jgi:hypothetical protein
MKRLIWFGVILLTITVTNLYGQDDKQHLVLKADTAINDSIEYDLIIIDTGFEGWLASQPSVAFLSKSYYENKNRLYVTEWNYRYLQPQKYGPIYEDYIDYRNNIDYGLDFNYRLYYYFKYFEQTRHVSLIPGKN